MSVIVKIFQESMKKLPKQLGNLILYAINWITQGFLFASSLEKFMKIIYEIFLFSIALYTLSQLFTFPVAIIFAFIFSHTMNWLTATNIHSTRIKRNRGSDNIPKIREKFSPAADMIQNNINSSDHVQAAVIFGSFARGEAHVNSDLDVHLYSNNSYTSILMCYITLFKIRTLSNIYQYPIDIWVETSLSARQINQEEVPIIMLDHQGYFKNSFQQSIDLTDSKYFK